MQPVAWQYSEGSWAFPPVAGLRHDYSASCPQLSATLNWWNGEALFDSRWAHCEDTGPVYRNIILMCGWAGFPGCNWVITVKSLWIFWYILLINQLPVDVLALSILSFFCCAFWLVIISSPVFLFCGPLPSNCNPFNQASNAFTLKRETGRRIQWSSASFTISLHHIHVIPLSVHQTKGAVRKGWWCKFECSWICSPAVGMPVHGTHALWERT